jgi:hypothetical protein
MTTKTDTSPRYLNLVRDSNTRSFGAWFALALALAAALFSFGPLSSQAGAAPPANQSPINLTPPVLSGSSVLYQTVSVTDGTWDAVPAISSYNYQWQRRDRNTGLWGAIAGAANQNTYTRSSYANSHYNKNTNSYTNNNSNKNCNSYTNNIGYTNNNSNKNCNSYTNNIGYTNNNTNKNANSYTNKNSNRCWSNPNTNTNNNSNTNIIHSIKFLRCLCGN